MGSIMISLVISQRGLDLRPENCSPWAARIFSTSMVVSPATGKGFSIGASVLGDVVEFNAVNFCDPGLDQTFQFIEPVGYRGLQIFPELLI